MLIEAFLGALGNAKLGGESEKGPTRARPLPHGNERTNGSKHAWSDASVAREELEKRLREKKN